MKKILLILVGFVCLNGCVQSTALLGPAITVGTTGNVYQASLSYGSNMAVKQITGKTPSEHVTSYIDNNNKEKKFEKEITRLLQSHIEIMRKKLALKR